MSENFRALAWIVLLTALAVGVLHLTSQGRVTAQIARYFSLVDRECEDAQQQYYDARDGLGVSKNKYPAQQEERRGDAHDHADVCAQNRMADAAQWGFYVLVGTLLSVLLLPSWGGAPCERCARPPNANCGPTLVASAKGLIVLG